MTALVKIQKYLEGRTSFATAYEVANYAKVNYNTCRKILGAYFAKGDERKCRISGKRISTYGLV